MTTMMRMTIDKIAADPQRNTKQYLFQVDLAFKRALVLAGNRAEVNSAQNKKNQRTRAPGRQSGHRFYDPRRLFYPDGSFG
jgi:hypothetical protein